LRKSAFGATALRKQTRKKTATLTEQNEFLLHAQPKVLDKPLANEGSNPATTGRQSEQFSSAALWSLEIEEYFYFSG